MSTPSGHVGRTRRIERVLDADQLVQLRSERGSGQQHEVVRLASHTLDEPGTEPVLVRGILHSEPRTAEAPVVLQGVHHDVRIGHCGEHHRLAEPAGDRGGGQRADVGHAQVPHHPAADERRAERDQLTLHVDAVLPRLA